MISPLNVATGGYLGGDTLCIATKGYICGAEFVIPPVEGRKKLFGGGGDSGSIKYKQEYKQWLEIIRREDEEIMIIIKAFIRTL